MPTPLKQQEETQQQVDDEEEEDGGYGEVGPDSNFDYIQWLQKKFDAVLSLEKPPIPPVTAVPAPTATESATASTEKQVSDLDKALAVVRVRVHGGVRPA